MDQLDFVLLFSRWAHITAAIIAVGGAAYAFLALQPGARDSLDDAQHKTLREAVRRRWSPVLFACIAVLFVSGGVNFYKLALLSKIEPMPYHAIFGVKFLVALVVFFIASVLSGRSPGLAKLRENSSRWLGILLVLSALIVVISGALGQIRAHSAS